MERLRARLAEAEETLSAIRSGEVDALAVDGPHGRQIFTLQSADEPYRILAERMNEGAATLTAEGTVLFCNRRLAEMAGVPPERLVGSSLVSLVRQDERERFQGLLAKALQKDVRTESDLLGNDGTMVPVQLSLSSIPLEDRELGICLVATDLTARKHAEAALQAERRRFESVLDHLPSMVCLLTPDHDVAFASRSFRKLFGEAQGRKCYEYCFGKSAPCEFCESFQVLQTHAPHEWEVTTPNGRLIHALDLPFSDTDGSPLVLEVDVDITEQRQSEEKLREVSRYNRSLIEASLDPLVTISREGKITDVNQATEKVTGVCRDLLIGSDFSSYFTDPQDARRGYEQVFAQGTVQEYPLAIRSAAGKVTNVLYNASLFRNEAGEVEGVFAAARDVTERNRAEEEVRKLNEELEQRVAARTEELRVVNRELEAFNYAVAHDLRAPLRHIHGFAEMLADEARPVLTDSSKHQLDTILDSVQHMSQLLEDLLKLSRLGRQELCKQVCSANSLIAEVVKALEPESKGREVEWRIADLPPVECDPTLFKQVLVNLLSNALKFTRTRHPAIIEIGCMTIEGDPVIFIRDNGVGYSMKYADKLFGLFQRLHRQQDFEGTGVGLAIVQRIMHRHGGRVWAEAEPDKGATFYVSLHSSEAGKKELASAHAAT